MDVSPTARRLRLGVILRRLREDARMTGEQVAGAVERSASWVSRVEAGRLGLRKRDLQDLLDLYGVRDQERRSELEGLVRQGSDRGWLSPYRDSLPRELSHYIGLEEDATELLVYEDRFVPGLLQTSAYARAIFETAVPRLSPSIIDARLHVRLTRQRLLSKIPPLRLECVLDEAVLLRAFCGSTVLTEQLAELVHAARQQHIEIRVLPLRQRARDSVTAGFTILRFENLPEIVYIESLTGGIIIQGPEVEAYKAAFGHVRSVAMTPTASLGLVRRTLREH